MKMLVVAIFLLVGVINALPLIGVVSAERLESLYGVRIADPGLELLMRHRAVLFGIVGGLLIGGAFVPSLRAVAVAAGLVSMLSFVVIAGLVGEPTAPLRRLVWIDVVASIALVGAALLDRFLPAADAEL